MHPERSLLMSWIALCLLAVAAGTANAQTTAEPLETDITFGTTVVIPGGLRGSVYLIPKNTMVLPDFTSSRVKGVGEIWTNELNIMPRHWRAGFPGLTDRNEWFAIDYQGRFFTAKPGRYVFALLSDDGSRLSIDDTPVIDNDCTHPPDLRLGAAQLNSGVHSIRVSYFQGPRDCLALLLAIAGPDGDWRVFDVSDYKPPSNLDGAQLSVKSSAAIVPVTPAEASLRAENLFRQITTTPRRLHFRRRVEEACDTPAVRVCN